MENWERLINELRAELILREQELELIHAIDLRLLAPEQPAAEIFTFIVERLTKLLQADHTTILLRRSTFLEPMYSNLRSVVGQRVPISESLIGLCLETESTINVPDLTASPHRARYAPLRGYRGPQMRSLLATPIRIRDAVVGVLNVESVHAGLFKPVHERTTTAVAANVAIALQRTQMLASNVLFADLDRLMFDSDDTQHVIQIALERVMAELQRLEHVRHSGAQIMFLRGDDELEIVHSTNPMNVGLMLGVDRSVAGRAVRERKTIIVGDVSKEPEFWRMLGPSIHSEIAVPILFGDDEIVIGVLAVEGEEEDAFSGFYQIVLESFAEKVRTMLAFAKLRADVTEALEMRSADDLLVAVGDQTSHMIHRLNNVVGAMRVRVRELQDMQEEGTLEGSEFLNESLAALKNLADQALEMPNEVTRMLSQDSTTFGVNDCVRDALDQLDLPGGIVLELHLADEIPPLPLYRFDIVVQNIIQNAIDAMPDGGKLTVSTLMVLDPVQSTGYFQLVVRDTGSGIPEEIRRRIFELNFTTKHGKGKGLGLGLWWVRNFVRRARGDITVSSTIGSGTEVTVKIPITRADGTRPGSEARY